MFEFWAAFLVWLHSLELLLTQSDLVYLGALIALLGASYPFTKRLVVFVYKNYLEPIGKFFNTFITLPDRLQSLETKMEEKIDVMKAELKPNGGHSIKDVITRLDGTVTVIANSLATMKVQSDRMEVRQQSILNSVVIPTFETDSGGNCIFANRAYLDLVGRSMEEVKGQEWINIIHPEDRDAVKREWAHAIEEKRNFELTYRIVCREKLIYDVACVATPITGNGYIGKFEEVNSLGHM